LLGARDRIAPRLSEVVDLWSRLWGSAGVLSRSGAAAGQGLSLQRPPPEDAGTGYGPTTNSIASESDVVWFEVLKGSRYQSCAWTTAPAPGFCEGFAVQRALRS